MCPHACDITRLPSGWRGAGRHDMPCEYHDWTHDGAGGGFVSITLPRYHSTSIPLPLRLPNPDESCSINCEITREWGLHLVQWGGMMWGMKPHVSGKWKLSRRVCAAAFRATLTLPWKPVCEETCGDAQSFVYTVPFFCWECRKVVCYFMAVNRPQVLPPDFNEYLWRAEKQFQKEYRRIRRSGG